MKDYMYKENFDKFPLAMAYVPWQRFNGIYDNLDEALDTGTIFPELDKPFTGRRCCKK
ncbi:MAG: spore coat associated protein CotJA [Lachnospiraceae bacterium]|nr:spore coat associated protein CotJA [Lachnospiraceae bacterium]MBD5486186.1 spore coat associated protein CotJA [Lachnospiraceae bacterium]MBD5490286.1 spore coat associated protein CotJA [Lachnospiraceae bacterium]MBD5502916.1 spore coat associated protein CotJA [Lachnospiraceae bacterium]MBD5516027.1 spore coat associated protein CotJA [Lachnospiraceae bacterium]